MADFEPAWKLLMRLEGGDLMHEVQGDPGGRTRFGVAENHHPDMWEGGPPSEEEAQAFYRRRYWHILRLGEIASQEIADEIFECAVNISTPQGGQPNVALRMAQEATNDVRTRAGQGHISEDGLIGPETIAALNDLGSNTVASMAWDGRFNLRQLRYYYHLRDDLVDRFFEGWSVRVWS